MSEPRKDEQDQKPGAGVDRTLIRRMLAMTPEERLKTMVEESNNLRTFFGQMRRR